MQQHLHSHSHPSLSSLSCAPPPAPPPPSPSPSPKEAKSLFCLLATTLVSILFILSFSRSSTSSSRPSSSSSAAASSSPSLLLLRPSSPSSPPLPPSLAYFLSASAGDSDRLLRLLFAVYHPNNHYLLHLDLSAPQDQRRLLALSVQAVPAFRAARNVHVLGKADFANPAGPSALAATLHGAAVLLRLPANWDWFVNLNVDDYPLVTQDDLLHVLSFLPKELNFVQHSSLIGRKESHKLRPIIVDPGLYLSSKSDIFYATQKRELPNAYSLFTGSPSVILSRKFVDFCIFGSDNLPRILLMYFANTHSSQSNYFQTALCNTLEFNRTTVNYNMHHVSWDDPPKKELRALGMKDFEKMTESGAAFATKILKNDLVLDRIDRELLNRSHGMLVPGGWCLGREDNDDPCTVWGDAQVLRPGPGAERLSRNLVQLLSNGAFHSHQCVSESEQR